MSKFYLKPVNMGQYNREIGPYNDKAQAEAMLWHYKKIYITEFKVIEKDE